jgi:hypothetical protein
MSDDTRQEPGKETPKPPNIFGDLGNDSYDPNPSQQELGTTGLDDETPAPDTANADAQSNEKAAVEPEPPAEDRQAAKSEPETEAKASEGPEIKRKSPVNDNRYVPMVSPIVLAKADELRRLSSAEPTLVGKDAHLLRYDPEAKRYVPRDEEAAAILESMGDEADVKIAHGGSFVARPLKWDAGSQSMVNNPSVKPELLARTDEHRKSITLFNPETTNQKLVRASKERMEKGADEEGASLADNPRDQTDESPGAEPPKPMTAGATAVAGVVSAFRAFSQAIGKLLRFIANLTKAGGAQIARGFSSAKDSLGNWQAGRNAKANADHMPDQAGKLNLDDINRNMQKMRQDPLKPNEVANASKSMGTNALANRINSRNRENLDQVAREADGLISDHKRKMGEGIAAIESGMHLNEAGQIPVHSPQDFETRARRSSPDDRKQITSGLQTLVASVKEFRNKTANLVNGEAMSGVAPKDRAAVMSDLSSQTTQGINGMEPHKQKIMDNASVQGEGIKGKLNSMVSGMQSLLESRISQESEKAAAQTQEASGPRQEDIGESVAPR